MKIYKPMAFWGGVAAVLAVIAAVFFIPIVTDFLVTGLVPKFPTLIICGFVMLAAIQSFFSGIVLQTICQKNYQDFEMELQKCRNEVKGVYKDNQSRGKETENEIAHVR